MFAVGDVKQSIYRFRLAEPGLFLDKYERYGCHQGGSRIDLNENFRSSKTIINGVNYLFRQMMSRNVMEIDYDAAAEMKPGLSERGVPVSVLLLDRDALSQNAEAASAAESAFSGEIRMVADQIAQLHEQGYAYSDMAILLRSSRKNEPIVVDTLAAMGIPADAQTGHDYTDSAEIELVLSILQIIDNPRQDIHLVAVLRSALFDFGPDDLVELRLQDKKAAFIDVLYMISEQNSTVALKSRAFLQTLEEWRSLAAQTKVSELLLHIYHGSGLYNLMGALPDGQRRQANMRMLFERACQYEMNNYAGLFRFIKLIEDGRSFNVAGGYSHLSADRLDSVQVMSIHKSKGLEFPVVFVVGLNAQFNVRDEYADIIFQRDLGIGLRCVDTQRRYKYSSLVHWAIAQRQHEQSLAEEMRILYVALTRAKERLFLSAGVKTLDKRLDQWAADGMTESLCLPDHVLSAARCALDWLMPALLRHADAKLLRDRLIEAPQLIDDESRFDFCICDKLPDLQSTSSQSDFSAADSADLSAQMYEQVKNILGYTYPYKKNCNYPAKWSVSRLNRLPVPPEDVPETALLLSDEANAAVCNSSLEQISKGEELPKQHSISISADMRGTAYHRVPELLDLSRTAPEQIEEQVLQMCSSGKLSPQQAAAVRTDRIIRFFSTREGRQLAAALQVQRETAFTMTMPLDEQERVVVQGVLDVAYRVDNGWVLLDYKTGCYGKSDEELFVLYGKQMAYYCQAIERLWREPVQAAYLCLLDLGRNLLIPVEYLK